VTKPASATPALRSRSASRTAAVVLPAPGRASRRALTGARARPYFSTKYFPLPWPLENQRLVMVFLRV
jgi:hypothetical protein